MHNKNGSAVLIVIIIILVLAIIALGYFFVKSQPSKEISTTPAATTATASPTLSPSQTAASKPVVVFESEGSFSQTEKTEIYNKVINPYIDYYLDQPNETLLTITIAKNLMASKDTYPYSAKTIFKNGGNAGFLIMKEGTGVAWWVPECMNGCKLSDSFKVKYPEIASKVQ